MDEFECSTVTRKLGKKRDEFAKVEQYLRRGGKLDEWKAGLWMDLRESDNEGIW
jgi:hypothetical protein